MPIATDFIYQKPVLHGPAPPQVEDGEKGILIKHAITQNRLVLTPEEWVRQNLVLHLLAIGYPKGLTATERQLRLGRKTRRYDVLVFMADLAPFLVAECKAPSQPINLLAHLQAAEYNKVLLAKYVLLTNGTELRVFSFTDGVYTHESGLPVYPKP